MKPIIYTTGAHLQPMKIRNNDGTECWIWAVLEFVDDSFKDGEAFNPQETGNSLECLLIE